MDAIIVSLNTNSCTRNASSFRQLGTCTLKDMNFTVENNGVKATYLDGCDKHTVEIPGVDGVYEALQFHLHTSSEHTINDRFFGAELHIVHKSTTEDRYAVVGMMIDPVSQDDNEIFAGYMSGWMDAADAKSAACGVNATASRRRTQTSTTNGGTADQVYDLLQDDTTFFHYDGGLTNPPCSEVVWWNLADTAVPISVRQFQEMTTLMFNYLDSNCELGTLASPAGSTSRPVQPLNGRTVKRICPVGYEDTTATENGGSTTSSEKKSESSSSGLTVGLATVAALSGAFLMV
jgi:carbonic anhydrase